MINLCRGLSIDCSSSVSQSLAIKGVREQIGEAREGRLDLTVYRLECVPVTRQERRSPGQCHGERLSGDWGGTGMHRWQEGEPLVPKNVSTHCKYQMPSLGPLGCHSVVTISFHCAKVRPPIPGL